MKIHLSDRGLVSTQTIAATDIPLAKVETDNVNAYVDIQRNPALVSVPKKIPVRPLDAFTTANPYVFDESGNRVTDLPLFEKNGSYVFRPRDAVEFTPTQLEFSALVRKNMNWSASRPYRISAGYAGSDELLMSLMAIFGDAPQRGIAPSNVLINDGNMELSSLINKSIAECDFLFIESADGVHWQGTTDVIPAAAYLADNVNLWLAVDSFDSLFVTGEAPATTTLRSPMVYGTQVFPVAGLTGEFNADSVHSGYPSPAYSYQQWFSDHPAALILEKDKGGFIIVTEKKLLAQAAANVKLIYELLLAVYSRSWDRTPSESIWITDWPVDYLQSGSARGAYYHQPLNMDALFRKKNIELNGQYIYAGFVSSKPGIAVVDVSSRGDLSLRKTGTPTDPKKPDGTVSAYTRDGSVIQYAQKVMYKVETGIQINSSQNELGWAVTLSPILSSEYGIQVKNATSLALSDTDTLLCCKNNLMELIAYRDYDESIHGLWIARFIIRRRGRPIIRDLRIQGGGLPPDCDEDYSLIDIGRVEGRPLRYGSAIIIKLPLRLKPQEDKIRQALAEHMSAAEYPVLVFE